MFFFQTKDLSMVNSVKPNTVYRRKDHGYGVFVCGVSRPKSKSFVEENGSINATCVINAEDGTSKKFDTFLNSINNNEYIHSKKDFDSVVVMFKTSSITNGSVQYAPLSKFLELHELVIGFTTNGDMIADSMLCELAK